MNANVGKTDMNVFSLSNLEWELTGWRPFHWKFKQSMETNAIIKPEIAPLKANVPGSVHETLLKAGIIENWNIGLASRNCEWVEHRHWEYCATLPSGIVAKGESVVLEALGLDYSGWILIDGKELCRFCGTLKVHKFILTEYLNDGKSHEIKIIFEEPPPEQGEVGFTSSSTYFKPRFNYGWDWCPHLVPIGIWDELLLKTGAANNFELGRISTKISEENNTGSVNICIEIDDSLNYKEKLPELTAIISDGQKEIASVSQVAKPGNNQLIFEDLEIEPWWPNGEGNPKTYLLKLTAFSKNGGIVWNTKRKIGFKNIEWKPCENAPPDADPWICIVNGKPIFLQGINWTPAKLNYHDVTEKDLRQLIGLYREMGCNLFRVWGGSYLETEMFYNLCDEAGIMVWQDFPLSSSAIENWPPESSEVITRITEIATGYIKRRRHHVSLLMWCGGNELQGELDGSKTGCGQPVDRNHPCMKSLAKVVLEQDPGRRFVPTSSSGPRFIASKEDFGKNLHHDVHGPWSFDSDGIEGWKEYWRMDDSLFRSELGIPSAVDIDLLKKYLGPFDSWPPTNEYWNSTCCWHIQWERFKKIFENVDSNTALTKYIEITREEQEKGLEIAAKALKNRFPACGGVLIWMGHDNFPCAVNCSFIDFERKPKPAYFTLQKVFQSNVENIAL